MSSQDEFLSLVRDALKHLYDYHHLNDHPLALQYVPDIRRRGPTRAERFSRLLLESIEEISPPDASVKDTSRTRYYSLLVHRYVEERPLADIMREMGYSRAQFYREQQKAISVLASVLQRKLPWQTSSPTEQGSTLHTEAKRVLAQLEAVDAAEVIQGVLSVVSNLAEQRGVTLAYDLDPGLPPFYGSRTLLRQVFLRGLSIMIFWPGIQHICIQVCQARQRLTAELIATPGILSYRADNVAGRHELDLEPVRRLVELVGGRWHGIELQPDSCTCRFDFPADSKKVLLVIDDNEGLIRVLQGYLAGYGYLVIGVTTGSEALQLAREVNPTAITLDIMMPTQDGWEILQALKNDPVTQHIPVIVCSVLEDPELALSLGATYLHKPIAQAELLAALGGLPGTS